MRCAERLNCFHTSSRGDGPRPAAVSPSRVVDNECTVLRFSYSPVSRHTSTTLARHHFFHRLSEEGNTFSEHSRGVPRLRRERTAAPENGPSALTVAFPITLIKKYPPLALLALKCFNKWHRIQRGGGSILTSSKYTS